MWRSILRMLPAEVQPVITREPVIAVGPAKTLPKNVCGKPGVHSQTRAVGLLLVCISVGLDRVLLAKDCRSWLTLVGGPGD